MIDADKVPERSALDHFGVKLVCYLGGRVNHHWLVDRDGGGVVLRRWTEHTSIDWEVELLDRLWAAGLPVPRVLDGPVEINGVSWSLAPYFAGEHVMSHGTPEDQRARGRLLAEFHARTASIDIGQRPGWRRCEEVIGDDFDSILSASSKDRPDEVRVLRWHLDRVRQRLQGLGLEGRPSILVHGDFTPWNLRYVDGRMTGILDFELSHLDHRVADFSLSWRGEYDHFVLGYHEVSPLEPIEWEALTPVYWTTLINIACNDLEYGLWGAGEWAILQLLRRTPLMGEDAEEYREHLVP